MESAHKEDWFNSEFHSSGNTSAVPHSSPLQQQHARSVHGG